MIQISCNQIKKYYGTTLILKDISFEVNENEKIALIGKNGSGKSTMLKLITGEEALDAGAVSIRKGAVIGYLEQQPEYDGEQSVQDVIRLAFQEQTQLRERMREMENRMESLEADHLTTLLKQYSALTEKYEAKGGYETEERFSRICTGLKLQKDFLEQRFSLLSGGEKTLACLAKVLLQNPDILILDEPTNHLDMGMLRWLEEYVTQYRGTVLMVSHDRYFLDQTAKRILEFEDTGIEEYQGNYTYYIQERRRRREEQMAAYKEQQKKIKDMEKAIKDMRTWAAQADNAKMFQRAESMQKRLNRMEKVEKPGRDDKGMKVSFEDTGRSGKDVLCLERLRKTFGNRVLFDGMNMNVFFKENVALIGRNGCGKTTLLKMILGEEEPDSGTVRIGSSLHIGYMPQHMFFQNEELTVLETFREDMMITEGKARELISRYQFTGESVYKKVKNLSGGEKSRLWLAKLMQNEINFLLLDEPTNHLDIISREKLEEALLQFEGTILMISHDRYFINKIASRIVEISNGTAESYPGNFNDYQEEMIKREKSPAVSGAAVNSGGQKGTEKKERERGIKEGKQKKGIKVNSYKEKLLEETIAQNEQRIAELSKAQKNAEYDYAAWEGLEREKKLLEEELNLVMEEWLLLTEG